MEIVWMLVVLVLYGVGMYFWGYHKALEKATEDLQNMKKILSQFVDDMEEARSEK